MNGWLEHNSSNTVVIFVHGLFSNSTTCWTSKNGTFWPKLILQDGRLGKPSVFLSHYYTAPSSADYGIRNCAEEICQLLHRIDSNEKKPPIAKRNLVFVAHSSGGVVVRYMLEAYSEKFIGKKVGVCLYASPSLGSNWSTIFQTVARLCGNNLAMELCASSPILSDLDVRFAALLSKKKLDISGIELCENTAPFGLPFGRIVNQNSASRYFGKKTIIPKTDHNSIVKPNTIDDLSHQVLYDYLSENNFIEQHRITNGYKRPSLFDRYSSEVEPYYLRRTVDDQLLAVYRQYHVWIFGCSGTGKTAAISRMLSVTGTAQLYISLGAAIGSSAPELLKDVYFGLVENSPIDLNAFSIPETIELISKVISERAKENTFCLFIEEIPITNEKVFSIFSNYIYAIIMKLESNIEIRIALSSIYMPNMDHAPEQNKITEKLKIIEWSAWNDEDILNLINLIRSDTGINSHAEISTFHGSPRSVKNWFRDELSKSTAGEIL